MGEVGVQAKTLDLSNSEGAAVTSPAHPPPPNKDTHGHAAFGPGLGLPFIGSPLG